MTQSMLFTGLIPAALLAVLAIVVLASRLSDATRRGLEVVLALVFYPVFVVFWGWRAWSYGVEGNAVLTILMFALACLFAVQGVIAVCQRRFMPLSRRRAS